MIAPVPLKSKDDRINEFHPSGPIIIDGGLEKYTGQWGFAEAAHLLRRTTYGADADTIQECTDKGLDATIARLLSDIDLPEPPLNLSFEDDPLVPVGQTWVDKSYNRQDQASFQDIVQYRRRSLFSWTMENLLSSDVHIREKLTLFWNNHFVTQASVLQDPNLIYYNNNLLRRNALGNFRTFVQEVTINPAMLRYLNGNQNTNVAPNENYARELLELFTIGKGDLAGPGDYTTFTEDDVTSIAKILTGWRDTGYYGTGDLPLGSFFRSFFHDTSTKKLSHRFNDHQIDNNGRDEYKDLIEVILQQDEVSAFLCRKLYRWFVYYKIDEAVESQIIQPLAGIMRESDYEIKPVLEALLSSQHFYDICSLGPMIKNPIDFTFNLLRQFNVNFPAEPIFRSNILLQLARFYELFQLNYYEPPNVAGWKAYYQEPLYYRTWITSATLPVHQQFTNAMSTGARLGDFFFGIDILSHISSFKDAFDPNALIEEFVSRHLPQPLTQNQLDYLKDILIPGLPDFEWTVEYGNYVGQPDNPEVRRSVENKLRTFLAAFMSLPEYYLS